MTQFSRHQVNTRVPQFLGEKVLLGSVGLCPPPWDTDTFSFHKQKKGNKLKNLKLGENIEC